MNIGIVILCRFDSKRLPGKILHDINGRPIIGHIIERIRYAASNRSIVVATSNVAVVRLLLLR
jgi:spore coat polysaccharide biosynthesis protein SpsF